MAAVRLVGAGPGNSNGDAGGHRDGNRGQPAGTAGQVEVEYNPEDKPGALKTVVLGLQHVLAMFGATVLGPLLMGFDPNIAILMSGVATIMFYFILGGRLPSYLGSSFAFIAAVAAATGYSGTGPNLNIDVALGGIIVAGAIYFAVGLIVQLVGHDFLNRAFPPAVSGVIVGIIGLNLARVAAGEIGDTAFGIFVGLSTLLLAAIFSMQKGLVRQISILLAGASGYALYAIGAEFGALAAPVNFDAFRSAPLFGLPHFTTPRFELSAMLLIAPVALILIAENLGHIRAIGAMLDRPMDRYIGRAFMADGLGTILSGSAGGTGVTTYAENMGVMRATQNFASITFLVAGCVAILLGLSPKFGALIGTIPLPVLGGLAFVLFGLITGTAGVIWERGIREGSVHLGETRTLMALGVGLVFGAGDFTIRVGAFAMGGIVTATLAVLILYHGLGLWGRKTNGPAKGAARES